MDKSLVPVIAVIVLIGLVLDGAGGESPAAAVAPPAADAPAPGRGGWRLDSRPEPASPRVVVPLLSTRSAPSTALIPQHPGGMSRAAQPVNPIPTAAQLPPGKVLGDTTQWDMGAV